MNYQEAYIAQQQGKQIEWYSTNSRTWFPVLNETIWSATTEYRVAPPKAPKLFIVWCSTLPLTENVHNIKHDAAVRARILAKEYPNHTFYVLQPVSRHQTVSEMMDDYYS